MSIATPVEASNNTKTEYVEIEGGINQARLSRMWKAAKSYCYSKEYEEITEDKDVNALVCKQDGISLYVRFQDEGFTVRAQAIFAKMPLVGNLMSAPRKHRKGMIDELKKAAAGK